MKNRDEFKDQLENERFDYAMKCLVLAGYNPEQGKDTTQIQFAYRGHVVTFFPYSGYASGKSIKSCVGLKKLLKQLV